MSNIVDFFLSSDFGDIFESGGDIIFSELFEGELPIIFLVWV